MNLLTIKTLIPSPAVTGDGQEGIQLAYFYLDQQDAWWGGIQPVQFVPWLATVFQDEQPDSITPSTIIDDDIFNLPQQTTNRITGYLPPAEEVGSQLAYFYLDHENNAYQSVEVVAWAARPSLDDETGSQLTNFGLYDELPWVGYVEANPWLPRPLLDDETGSQLAYFPLEQEEFWTAKVEVTPWLSRPYLDDDLYPTQPSTISVDEDIPAYQQIQTITWLPRPSLDDETGSQLVYFYLDHENNAYQPIETVVWISRPFLDDEIAGNLPANFGLDDELPWVGYVEANLWAARPSLDDETGSQLTYFYLDPENNAYAPTETIAWVARPLLDDEIGASLFAPFGLDDELPWIGYTETIAWLPRPSLDDETGSQLAYFYLDPENDAYRPTEVVPWTSRPYLDDEIWTTPPILFGLEQEEGPVLFFSTSIVQRSWFATDNEILSFYVAPNTPSVVYIIRGHYDPDPTPIRGSRMYAINENRIVYRGDGELAWNLTLDPPPISGGYGSWTVIYQVTTTSNGVVSKIFTQTLTLIDAVSGVWQQTFQSGDTSVMNMPLSSYNESFWRTDQAPNYTLLRYGTLQLLGTPFQP